MLILETGRDDLLKPLQAVTGIVERKHTLPILSNILLQSENGQVQLLATDLEIQIHTLGAQGAQPDFRITTNAKKLQDILRALPDSSTVQHDGFFLNVSLWNVLGCFNQFCIRISSLP